MAHWINETVLHFLNEENQLNGCADKLFGKLDMEESYTGPAQLSWTDENDDFKLSKLHTYSTKFFAYTGYRYV